MTTVGAATFTIRAISLMPIQLKGTRNNDFKHFDTQRKDTKYKDTQHYDTQHNDTQHTDTQHNDTQHNDAQHNDTQHNDAQHNDTQHNDAQHNDTHYNDTQHNDTQHFNTQRNSIKCDTWHNIILSVKNKPIMLSVVMSCVVLTSVMAPHTYYQTLLYSIVLYQST